MAFIYDWYKAKVGMSTNTRLRMAAAKAGCSLSEVVHFWLHLLEKACVNNPRGKLPRLNFDEMSFELGIDEGRLEKIYAALEERGMVGKAGITHWKTVQDNPTDRKRNQREEEKKEESTVYLRKNQPVTERDSARQNVTVSKKERERTPNGVLEGEREKEKERQQQQKGECEREAAAAPPQSVAKATNARRQKPRQKTPAEPADRLPPDGGKEARRGRERGAGGASPQAVELAEQGGDGGNGEDDREIAAAVLAIWRQELPDNPAQKINGDASYPRMLAERFREGFDGDAEAFRRFCRGIKARPFLTGKVEKKDGAPPFHAPLQWAIQPEVVADIEAGKYGKVKFLPGVSGGKGGDGGNGGEDAITTAPPARRADWQAFHDLLRSRLGDTHWRSWLRNLHWIGCEADQLRLGVPTKFQREWIQGHFREELTAAVAESLGWDGGIELVVLGPAAKGQGVDRVVA